MNEKQYYAFNGDKFSMNDSPYSYDMSDAIDEMNRLYEENMIFRLFIELNDFDVDEILLQGRGLD